MLPQVEVEPPDVNVDEDGSYDKFTTFVLDHPRAVVVALLIVVLMILWKKPMFRGIVLGVLALAIVLSIATR